MKRLHAAALGTGVVVLCLAAAWGGSLFATRASNAAGAAHRAPGSDIEVIGYVCPMHSHIRSPHPGPCPICGMDLVPDRTTSNDAAAAGRGAPLELDAAARANLGVRLARAEQGDMHREVHTVGKLTRVDASAQNVAGSPIAGRISFIAEKQEGDSVQPGEVLFSVESDELQQQEDAYIAATKAGKQDEATQLSQALLELGLGPEDLAQLQDGTATHVPVSIRASAPASVLIRRGAIGDEVTPGFTVFNLGGDKQLVEVTAEIFEQQWGWVKEGQAARITMRSLPGQVFEGRVTRVDPPVGFATRALEVRIEFQTEDPRIAQNVFGSVTIEADPRPDVVSVPSEAVIRTEAGDRVVTVDNGRFRSVRVVCGEEAAGRTEIVSGLKAGTVVVASGQFLIDSESSRLAELARLDGRTVAAAPRNAVAQR